MRCSYHQDREAVGTCSRCGRGICEECNVPVNGKNVCKNCVNIIASQRQCNRKEPLLALILSFFIPGLGQVYNGNTNNGIILIIATVISWILTSVCVGFFIFIALWVYAMYDAYTTAEKINRGEISYP
jgi:TM2 domain-containing membrane protein YozV